MATELPVFPDSPSFTYAIVLTLATFQLTFNRSSRTGFWYLDIADAEGNPLVMGSRLVAGGAPLRIRRGTGFPEGQFVIVSPSGEDPGDTFGTDTKLLYYEPDEVTAAADG